MRVKTILFAFIDLRTQFTTLPLTIFMIQPRVWLCCFSSRSFAMKFLAAFAIGIPMGDSFVYFSHQGEK